MGEDHMEEEYEEDLYEEIYSEAYREDLVDNGEIESWEAAFIEGYNQAS